MAGVRAVGHLIGPGTWVAGSLLSSSTDGTILVDTGTMAPADYLFAFSGSATVAWTYDIQQIDSDGATILLSQRRRPAAGNDDFLFPNKFTLTSSQRMRCRQVGASTGVISMSIYFGEIG